mgnify:CR=1 FL=1
MREVKEKSSLKARAVETLKSAPQAAFRRGADASFQQLQQELREAAQDAGREARLLEMLMQSCDHAASLTSEQALYLKGDIMQVL